MPEKTESACGKVIRLEMPGSMSSYMTYLSASIARNSTVPERLMGSRDRTLRAMAAVCSHHGSPNQSK